MGYRIEKKKDDSEVIVSNIDTVPCLHDLYKAGAYVKCRKCTSQWFDPDNNFPLNVWKKKSKLR